MRPDKQRPKRPAKPPEKSGKQRPERRGRPSAERAAKRPNHTSHPLEAGSESIRLHAFLSRAGIASRRASEELIREGRVTVDGRQAEIGESVDPAKQVVRVDQRVVTLKQKEWIALHKPRGYVTTREDPSGRKTVYDLLPEEFRHLFHVGRLDRDSAGLLLFTNDGEAANQLLHPRYGTLKEYQADVEGTPTDETLEQLVHGVALEDGIAQALVVEPRGFVGEDRFRLRIVLAEGRNRVVRRMLEAVGHPVHRLFRLSFGSLAIGRLKPGQWRRLTPAEIEALTHRREPDEKSKPAKGRPRRGGGSRRSASADTSGLQPAQAREKRDDPKGGRQGGGKTRTGRRRS